ncbi:upstream stimulatory factor 1-like isoform X3 [Scleropages formosus]|uniref:upstream stimulatory factor 1-like isoform X3 n=1 Tax=Scleropages formosus TaxID=113540 RepID=UPI000878EF93|nr:upstream stimulatory factor 1-like isoform X3 [Scleropages formosus]
MKGQQKSPDSDGTVPIIEEGAVATAEDPSAIPAIQSAATFSSDQPIKYLFKTEGAGGQAVFSQSEGLEGESTETQYTYYPATISEAAPTTMVTSVQAPDSLLNQSTPTGQLYVMMSPQDVLPSAHQRSIAPRTQSYNVKSDAPRTSRDDKRRAQHNEVERRRRDKINNWIVQLSKTIPDCTTDSTKTAQSKGGILSKACDYIQELLQSNVRLAEELSSLERLRMDNQLLRQEVEDWKSKNQALRNQLRQHGVVVAPAVDPQ